MKLAKTAKMVREGAHEMLSYYSFPQIHWRHLRTNNPLERIMREIRRQTRVIGSFPNDESALMLVAAQLRHIAGTLWGTRMYMSMERFNEVIEEEMLTTAWTKWRALEYGKARAM
jgi:putative transposase